jgi:hypothetical protein
MLFLVNGWRAGEEVEFIYRLGEKPGFTISRLTSVGLPGYARRTSPHVVDF